MTVSMPSMPRIARFALVFIVACATGLSAGCHSSYVEADVHNASGGQVSLVEVDYPSASFGKELLPDGATFHYRFKILGSGATKVLWTDSAHHDHTVPGPELHEGEEGHLTVTLSGATATWDAQVHRRR
ncbi:MAG TPA: hypothetical protein VGN16_00455 [Acidobacteriaceae bacterium]|jgi:hypothetical protein